MIKTEVSWAGGLFEGEGSFYINKRNDRKNPRQVAMISMSDRDCIQRFRDAVGFGRVEGPYGPYQKGTKPTYRWATSGFEKTQALAAMLWPYLCERRRGQIKSTLIADPT